jgi:hypothetical protein
MNLTTKGLAAAALTTTLLAAGCTSSGNSTGDPASPPSASTGSTSGSGSTAPDQTAAAGLRATLTALLSDHVWLAGNALQTAVAKGGDLNNPAVKGAVAALDENSVALAKTLGSVYPAAQKPFLASWRQHIGFFVNYTLGKATKNAAMANKARADLDGYRTSFGQLIHSVVPELPADAVAQELVPHVQSLLTAIDAAVAGSPQVQTKLTDAADHMTMTAAVLTGGIVADQMITD